MADTQTALFSKYIHHIDRNNSLDFMRYILALSVLIEHFNYICGAKIPWVISSYNSVGVFFAISGFVLIGKLFKGCQFKQYVINRSWRIFPSYFFVVLSVAIGFCFVSTLTPTEYFTSSGFWKYLAANLGFLNFLHPDLPGFVTHTSANAVNGSLWTMKIEIQLSLIAPLFVWICRKYRLSVIKTIVFIILCSVVYRYLFSVLYDIYNKNIFEILGRQFIGQLLYFFAGISIYCFYTLFVKHLKYIIFITLTIYILTWGIIEIPYYDLWLQPFVVTGLVLGLSLLPVNLSKYIGDKNNISYELYLCHYPIIQLINHFQMPEKYGTTIAFGASVLLSLIFAAITYGTVGHLYKKYTKR